MSIDRSRVYIFTVRLVAVVCLFLTCTSAEAQTLEQRLLDEPPAVLAAAARELGDARRGAIVFHQLQLGCHRCHSVGGRARPAGETLGPDLAVWREAPTDQYLIEAVIKPSQTIRTGFEPLTVVTKDGKTITGLIVEDGPETVAIRDPQSGRLVRIGAHEIEARAKSATSIMPAGQVNQLASRQQFLDLVRYLIEIRDGGPDRARELQPGAHLLALQLPEYESHVDHAGLIRGLDDDAFQRGAAIYERLCVNCHGDHSGPGSLPTALRFGEGKFKNGHDPFALYQTLTRGFGFMTPQTWMVPRQKYDVIHYVRSEYLARHNPSQLFSVTEDYLRSLPPGDTFGPEPTLSEPWVNMDYGPSLVNTYEIGADGSNFAYKGIAVRLDPGPGGVSRGNAWLVFDHDTLRVAAAWTADPARLGERFIDWNGIHFNGRHQVHPRVVGDVQFANPTGPGWADPRTGRFDDDQRVVGRDGRRYGPLPRAWGRLRRVYSHAEKTVIEYTVGDTTVLEMPGMVVDTPLFQQQSKSDAPVITRTFSIGPRARDLTLLVATSDVDAPHVVSGDGVVHFETGAGDKRLVAGLAAAVAEAQFRTDGPRLLLTLAAGEHPLRFVLWHCVPASGGDASEPPLFDDTAPDLAQYTRGGPPRWPERLTTTPVIGNDDGPFAIDVLTPPDNNPWLAQLRLTGLDFYDDGDRMAVCAWDGDVWEVAGLAQLPESSAAVQEPHVLSWRRIASGLFQPLGLKIVDGEIYVTCRDQIAILRDRNGDGEIDCSECFNNDHQVTEHFHEFAMGLQVDDTGNFYYAKSARHALPAVVPHHGTLLRVSPDGARTDILATGFRAANGVCLNPDGSFVVTDQEGHWNPKNRINWVREGGFYGNMFGYHDVTDASDSAMEPPLCWITNTFDRSPAELLWVTSDRWGPLKGSLLNLSYGYGKVYVVPFEEVAGRKQGGMCELPIPQFPTGLVRGRFHPRDGQLYLCGMYAWAGSQQQPGGLYRLRATGRPARLPIGMSATKERLAITFTDPLNRAAAEDPHHYRLKVWSLKRTANYGSDHYDERALRVTGASLSEDGRTVILTVPKIGPTWCLEVRCELQTEAGERVERVIHGTVHALGAR